MMEFFHCRVVSDLDDVALFDLGSRGQLFEVRFLFGAVVGRWIASTVVARGTIVLPFSAFAFLFFLVFLSSVIVSAVTRVAIAARTATRPFGRVLRGVRLPFFSLTLFFSKPAR